VDADERAAADAATIDMLRDEARRLAGHVWELQRQLAKEKARADELDRVLGVVAMTAAWQEEN